MLAPAVTKKRQTGTKEAILVWGSWEQWSPQSSAPVQHQALSSALAASQGQDPSAPQAQPQAYHDISAADAVTGQEAKQFLKQEEAAWRAQPHPPGPFRTDITSAISASSQGQFNWPLFVQRREWFRNHFVGEEITDFEVGWSTRCEHAVFFGRRRSDGSYFTVNPWARNQAAELSWGVDDIAQI